MAQHSCLCGAATHQKPRKCRRMENVPKLCVLFVKGWARAGFRGCCARMRLGPAYSTRPNLRQSPAARRPSATLSPPSLLVSVLVLVSWQAVFSCYSIAMHCMLHSFHFGNIVIHIYQYQWKETCFTNKSFLC